MNKNDEKPYITKTIANVYNPNYGDDRICTCGHRYYRHFDGYEDNAPVGCKYCCCSRFIEAQVEEGKVVVIDKSEIESAGFMGVIRDKDDGGVVGVVVPTEYAYELSAMAFRLKGSLPDASHHHELLDTFINVANAARKR